MEPVYLGQPVFNPRPISPLDLEAFDPLPEDVVLPGSSDDDSEGTRRRKKRRREDIGYEYLRQQAGYTITFKLKGPFENGWRNPYRDHGVVLTAAQVADMRSRREKCDQQGVRASSPIDLTSGAEEDEDIEKHAVTNLRDRKGTSTANGWLTSNVQEIRKREPEDAEAGSPIRRRQCRVQRPTTLISDGHRGKIEAVEPGSLIREVDGGEDNGGEENKGKLEEEDLEELVGDGHYLEDHRSPSVELEYSSQSQSRHREASEISEGGHLNGQSPTTKPRIERRVLVKRVKDISQRIRLQQNGSDAMDELLLEREVLDDRISALSAVIADMKKFGNDKATVRKKRGRGQAQKDSRVNVLSVDKPKKFEEAPKEVSSRGGTNAKTRKESMEATEGRQLPPLSLLSVYRPNTEGKPEKKVSEQIVQADPNLDLLRLPSVRTDSSEISHTLSSESNGKQRSVRAIRKSEKRRENKREKRHKAAREKVARQQDDEAQAKGGDQDDETNRDIELDQTSKALASTINTEQPTRAREREQGRDLDRKDPVTVQASSVKDKKTRDTGGNYDQPQKEQPLTKAETTKQPRRAARKMYQSEAKDKNNETTMDNVNVVFGIKGSEAIVVGAKGKRVPIIIVDDYDSLVSSSQVSSSTACPTGWKPYKWLPGGQDYAERVLKEHLASIEAGGPSLDPFRSSVDSSSNESLKAAQKRNVRETKADLRKLSNNNIVDLTDFDIPEASRAAAQVETSGVEGGAGFQHKTLKPQTVSRRTSVDSVDTAWKKDHSSFFGESLSSGLKGITTNQRRMRDNPKHKDEVPMQSGKVEQNNLESMPRQVLGQFNNDGRESSSNKTEGVLSKDSSNHGKQAVEMTEEEKRASEALTDVLVSFMDTSSDYEPHENDQQLYTHFPEESSPGQAQVSSNPVIPTKVKKPSKENVVAAKNHVKGAPLVAADEIALEDVDETSREDSAAAKDMKAGTLRNNKDKQNSLDERRSSREEFLQSVRLHVSQKASKNLLTTSLDATTLSPHVLPASTNMSQFQYNRVDAASRSASSDYNAPKRKQKTTTPVLPKAQARRRISFTPNGNIKSGLEVRVPSLSPPGSQASPIVIEEASVRLRASPTKRCAPSLAQKPSEGEISKSIAEILPEAQVVAEKLPSGLSTNLLETDKQSLKFTSNEETDPSEHFSTQAELAKAQQSFQRDLQSPVKSQESSSPSKSPLRRTSKPELHRGGDDASRTPLLTSKDPYIGGPHPHSSSEELPSTQAMVDAMSPFAISTIKKPRKFLHTFTRPAAAVYGYIWGSSQEERNMPALKPELVDASDPAEPAALPTRIPTDHPPNPLAAPLKPPEPTLDPAVTFTYPAIDMATSSDSPSDPAHALSQPSGFIKPPRRASRKLNSALPPSDEESDFEETQKERGLVRDDRGRWSNLTTELSMVTPSQRTLRSYNSPRTGSGRKRADPGPESLSQDGQRRSGLEAAIEDAESWLGTWDVEGEMRRMGAGVGMGGSGSGSGSAPGSGGGVARGERNRVLL
ncbi:hypothetical protein MMC32_006787 [Xylographa parallela]|nr:hypothetical protein [Xylographa parallela]